MTFSFLTRSGVIDRERTITVFSLPCKQYRSNFLNHLTVMIKSLFCNCYEVKFAP
jgi:hypothetical protein